MKQYMKNYENTMGAKITNNLTALYFFAITKAIPKKICLASYLLSLFFERNQFLESTLIGRKMKTIVLLFSQLMFISSSFSEVKAVYNNDKVEISWTNPTGIQVNYFVIERSKNGKNFENILQVKGSQNENKLIEYYEVDNKPLHKKAYYRIRQIDVNGKNYYSEMVMVTNINYVNPMFSLFIKPQNNRKLKNYNEHGILVVLLDNNGNEFISKIDVIKENRQLIVTNSNVNLPTGDYIITATSDDIIYGKKIMVKGNNSIPTVYIQNKE
ncbi:MAG: hypothetical protein CO118_03350 [Flavobacteriales bacterium CG_4_9_14_3_um_filter_32_8]|nr:MAG: hypothetical protein CO118_03350 [Flavobacteriales bacterium CG_4_9_14_3_um_filter_32_8]